MLSLQNQKIIKRQNMENPFINPQNHISITEHIKEAFKNKVKGDTFEIPLHGFTREYVRAAIHAAQSTNFKYKTRSAKDRIFVLIIEKK